MAARPTPFSLALLLTLAASGQAAAQDNPTGDRPPASNVGGPRADPGRNGEAAPRGAGDPVNVSPGVGTVEGADGKPPIPPASGK